MTTGKTIALTRWTFVGKVMYLLFNMLSRLVITFLPRSKHLLISWLQSPSVVILEPPKIKSLTVSIISPSTNSLPLHHLGSAAAAAAAAAKSLQSCPTLCDPTDGSPSGSPVPGILQARIPEWVAISSNAWKWKVKEKSLSHVWLLGTPWTAAYQTPPFMGFSRQEYRRGLPLPSPMHESEKWKRSRSVVPMDCLPLNSITSHFFVRCWIYFFTVFLHCQSQSGDDLTTFMSSGLLLLKHAKYNLHGLKNQALKLVGTGFKAELNGDLKKPCDICGYYWSPFCAISFVIIF